MDLVLKNKYKIEGLSLSGSLKESIDTISYTMNFEILKNYALANKIGLTKGDSIEFYDKGFWSKENKKIFSGVIWTINESDKTMRISLECKERTVYLEESEDELLLYDGHTATQRATNICNDWSIPIGNFADTGIGLSKDRRKNSLYTMMWSDLKETAQKGGKLYCYRMGTSLDLIELGTNEVIYKLDGIIDDPSRKNTLDGVVTQVKVLGENKSKEESPEISPIVGVFKQGTDDYGTIQKIVQDSKVTDYATGQDKANSMFSTGEDTWTFKCVKDIPDIRAGDKVSLYDKFYYVTEITHNLGDADSMTMNAMSTLDDIRRKFYAK